MDKAKSGRYVLPSGPLRHRGVVDMTKPELLAICDRLEADYRDRFIAAGASAFNAWANATQIAVDADYGGSSGPTWNAGVSYARRDGLFGLFGRAMPFKTLQVAERELREEIERWLASGRRPRVFGWQRE